MDCKKIFTVNRLDNKEGRSFFREVFIRRGSTSGVYGVEEPHECYMTYTTERAEKEALKLYKHELKCRHQEAIERYCRDWDASGIGKSLAFAQKVNEAGIRFADRPNRLLGSLDGFLIKHRVDPVVHIGNVGFPAHDRSVGHPRKQRDHLSGGGNDIAAHVENLGENSDAFQKTAAALRQIILTNSPLITSKFTFSSANVSISLVR